MTFGRTNESFDAPWYKPVASFDNEALAGSLIDKCSPRAIIDVSSQPALWGRLLEGFRGGLLCRSSRDLERATSERHAGDLVEAHLIETLSGVGRVRVDFYCLRVRSTLPESVVIGAVGALENAREDGLVRFFGLAIEDEIASEALWRAHDAFEVILLPNPGRLAALAIERRVGVIADGCPPWPGAIELLHVNSPTQVRQEAIA